MTQSVVPKPIGRKPRSTGAAVASRPYHHGSLPTTLLEAAERVLRRDGLPGLTLRAIAREAGVSHTAPKHHFGDTAAILSELAAIGHLRLAAEMAERARRRTGQSAPQGNRDGLCRFRVQESRPVPVDVAQ